MTISVFLERPSPKSGDTLSATKLNFPLELDVDAGLECGFEGLSLRSLSSSELRIPTPISNFFRFLRLRGSTSASDFPSLLSKVEIRRLRSVFSFRIDRRIGLAWMRQKNDGPLNKKIMCNTWLPDMQIQFLPKPECVQ